MMKKTVLGVLVLGLLAGGFFYWWNSQADVRELNKGLPKGIMVVKGLWGDEYRVVNKIDGYEFRVPREWQGVKEIAYIPEREEMGYTGTSINLQGRESGLIGVDQFTSGGEIDSDLESWARAQSDAFDLTGDFIKNKVSNVDAIKTQEDVHFGGEYTYFFKKSPLIYSITGPSEEFIKYIIANGKW